jgi:ADP-ribosylglycohydrolase
MNINNLTKSDQRKALWLGSITGDAFVLGGHWIYDLDKLNSSFPDYSQPQSPLPDTYHKGKKLGDQTHYGDLARQLWQYLASNKGVYKPKQYRKEWIEYMRGYKGYQDRSSQESLAALQAGRQYGSHSNELGGTARVAAVYYWLEDPAQALAAAADQSKMTHDSPEAIAVTDLVAKALQIILDQSAARQPISAFEALLQARPKEEAKLINDAFTAVRNLEDFSAASIAKNLGQTCHARHALPATLAVLKAAGDYRQAMQLNVMIGGDSAARAMIIGALAGACQGLGAIPESWYQVMADS